ncbi:MAG: S46 family peptidase [Bacteroidales bacterium]|jgi:hypothetical protein|nr:S46 family peptidase [Bacteroidales bacterium]
MKKTYLLLLSLGIFASFVIANPDEGMWIPSKIAQLNYSDMQKLGCKLTTEEIYSINHSSLKDAIFQLQNGQGFGFCSGEIVSKQGLMFTNHHCGYEAITKLSSTDHNYLDDGYWAKNLNEEISVPDLFVSRVVRIEDVTATVLEGIDYQTKESERAKTISQRIKELEKNAVEGTEYKAKVSEMYLGGEYYLFIYEVFGDVRFVGAPPSSIGKFGGDTDNWMWPRHTGDFSIFRIYMSPDGKATKGFDKNNIPYVPLHSLPISIKHLEESDFTMIMGYPGTTERFISSYGMQYKKDFFNPTIVKLFDVQLSAQRPDMDANVEIKLALADSYASSANAWKNLNGEMTTLKNNNLIADRQKQEQDFMNWVSQDEKRTEKYGKVLENLKTNYEKLGPATQDLLYLNYGILMSGANVLAARSFGGLAKFLEKPKENKERIDNTVAELKLEADELFVKYFASTDKKIFIASLTAYYNDIPTERRCKIFSEYIFKNYKANSELESINKFADAVYTKSIFTDKTRMSAFLNKPNLKVLKNDPINVLVEYAIKEVMTIQGAYLSANSKLEPLDRLLIEGIREFYGGTFYPDANSSLRLTYGTVKSYFPKDGVYYKFITYTDGILEKENPTDPEFIVSKELKDRILAKQFGRYADTNGKMPVCFLSDNDITGGNSGSPIMNANGELIGLAFDGNWEWLASNLSFNTQLQRTINVDSRYVLWVIDEVYGAKNLINELDIRQ